MPSRRNTCGSIPRAKRTRSQKPYLDDVYAVVPPGAGRGRPHLVSPTFATPCPHPTQQRQTTAIHRPTSPASSDLPVRNLGGPLPIPTRTRRLHCPGRATGLTRVCPTPTPPHIGRPCAAVASIPTLQRPLSILFTSPVPEAIACSVSSRRGSQKPLRKNTMQSSPRA